MLPSVSRCYVRLMTASLFALMLAWTAPVSAQSSPQAEAAAKELVIAMRADQQLKNLFPILMQQLKPMIVQGRPNAERDFDSLLPVALEAMNEGTTEFVASIAALYARNFSVEELGQIVAFYKTAAGQKMLDKQPVLIQESAAVGQKWGQDIAVKLQQRMTEELKKRAPN